MSNLYSICTFVHFQILLLVLSFPSPFSVFWVLLRLLPSFFVHFVVLRPFFVRHEMAEKDKAPSRMFTFFVFFRLFSSFFLLSFFILFSLFLIYSVSILLERKGAKRRKAPYPEYPILFLLFRLFCFFDLFIFFPLFPPFSSYCVHLSYVVLFS